MKLFYLFLFVIAGMTLVSCSNDSDEGLDTITSFTEPDTHRLLKLIDSNLYSSLG